MNGKLNHIVTAVQRWMVMGMREKVTKLLTDAMPSCYSDVFASQIADNLIANDVVPVVRCKDCKHWHAETEHFVICSILEGFMQRNDYCSYGERKDND
jgi:hypothetical protein